QQPPAAPPQGRPAPAGAGAGYGNQAQGASQNLQSSGTGGQGADMFGGRPPQQRANKPEQGGRGRQPQLPPRGGARAELPGGGNPQPRVTSWGDENAQPPVGRTSMDAPRGHEEPDTQQTSRMPRIDQRQGPAGPADFGRPGVPQQGQSPAGRQDTGQFPRPGAGANGQQPSGGGYTRSDVFGSPNGQHPQNGHAPANPNQFAAPQAYDNSSTGQFAQPGYDGSATGQHALPVHQDPSATGQFERPQLNGTGGYGQPQPSVPPRPATRPEPEALPPATGPGDGRTPLYDTLETNWFHGGPQAGGQAPAPQAPQQPAPQQQAPANPQRAASTGAAWRTSPNDELVRQAERVRQPAAGGVTTSGLPRRVPRANLVPGTAQQQQHQTGPQVSRAPDDVRGRLTNLRRGIAQGRQAGNGPQTGSFPSPTHPQER
ncbi:hypothetical protein JTP77_022465, partial [Streptomyces sp. S9]|nr:hypothetical protein [Streptomyces sp. S9]